MALLKKYVYLPIALLPFCSAYPIAKTDAWYSHLIFLLLFLAIGVGVFLFEFNKPIAVFIGYHALSSVFVSNQSASSIFSLFLICFLALMVRFISMLDKEQCGHALSVIFGVFILNAFWIFLQFLNLDPIFNLASNPLKDDTVAFFGSHNQAALFFAVTSVVAVSINPVLSAVSLFAIALTKCSSAAIGMFVSIGVYAFYSYRKAFWVGLSSLLIILPAFFFKVDSLNPTVFRERFELWKHSASQVLSGAIKIGEVKITCNPLFGFGAEQFMKISPPSQSEWLRKIWPQAHHVYEHAHNDYVEMFFNYGIFGVLILLAWMFDLIRRFIVSNKTRILLVSFCMIVAQMVSALGIYTMFTAASGFIFCVALGIFYGEVLRQRSGNGLYPVLG